MPGWSCTAEENKNKKLYLISCSAAASQYDVLEIYSTDFNWFCGERREKSAANRSTQSSREEIMKWFLDEMESSIEPKVLGNIFEWKAMLEDLKVSNSAWVVEILVQN